MFKKILLVFCCCFFGTQAQQSIFNTCENATLLPIDATVEDSTFGEFPAVVACLAFGAFSPKLGLWKEVVGTGDVLQVSLNPLSGSTGCTGSSLAVYSSDCSELNCLALADNLPQKKVTWLSEAGRIYKLFLTLAKESPNAFTMTVTNAVVPVNSECVDAIMLDVNQDIAEAAAVLMSNLIELVDGTTQGGMPDFSSNRDETIGNGSPAAWYTFIGTGNNVKVTTCSSSTNFLVDMTVYTNTCEQLIPVMDIEQTPGCVDLNGRNLGSTQGRQILLSTVPGDLYHIRVNGLNRVNQGDFSIGLVELEALPPVPSPEDAYFICFSKANVLTTRDRGVIPMEDVKVGDKVQVDATGTFSRVYSLAHAPSNTQVARFVQLYGAGMDLPLELTPDHMVFITADAVADPVAVPASLVRVGDKMIGIVDKDGAVLDGKNKLVGVIRVSSVIRAGVLGPLTMSGTILVNGVVASSYPTVQPGSTHLKVGRFQTGVSMQWVGQLGLAPRRLLCSLIFEVCRKERYDGNDDVPTWLGWYARIGQKTIQGQEASMFASFLVILAIALTSIVYVFEILLHSPVVSPTSLKLVHTALLLALMWAFSKLETKKPRLKN